MRKSLFILAGAFSLAMLSCNKEEAFIEQDKFTFKASLELTGKTVLDNKLSYWDGTESIVVFDNTGVKKLFDGTATKQSSINFDETDNSIAFTGTEYFATYPSSAAERAVYSDSKVSGVRLKREQNAVENSYDPEAHIAFANSSSTELTFLNAVSLFAFTIEGDDITEVRISSNAAGEYLAGVFEYDYANKSSSITSEQSLSVSVKGNFENGKTYYAAVLPCNFSAGLSIDTFKNGEVGKKKSSSKAFNLSRNRIVDLGTVSYEATQTKTSSHNFHSPDFGLEGEVGAELYKNNGPAVEGDVNWYLTVNIGEPIYYWKTWGLQIGIGWNSNTAFHVQGMNLWTDDISGQIKSVSIATSDSDEIDNSEVYVLVNGVQFGEKETLTNNMTKFTFNDGTLPSGKIEIVWNTLSGGLSYYIQSVEVEYQE